MRKKILVVFAFASLTFLIFTAKTAVCQSHDTAIAVGKSVTTQINCSERAGGIEVYDGTITLLEIVRGPKAWERLKDADGSNPEPGAGYEYMLARISFKMKARGAPGDKTFDLGRPLQFTAFSENFEEYGTPKVIVPKPELRGRVPADQLAEGWIAFAVKQEDRRPLMMFDPSSGGAWSRGKISFFRLYQE